MPFFSFDSLPFRSPSESEEPLPSFSSPLPFEPLFFFFFAFFLSLPLSPLSPPLIALTTQPKRNFSNAMIGARKRMATSTRAIMTTTDKICTTRPTKQSRVTKQTGLYHGQS